MYHSLEKESVLRALHTAEKEGLSDAARKANLERYGRNTLEKKKKKSLFSRILESLTEPMLLILVFSLAITFGANLGKFLKSGEGDFIECAGILFSIVLSVTISLVMEGSSERAFRLLAKMYDNVHIRVIRGGKTVYLPQEELCVGDIVLLSGGDKIAADGRLLSCVDFRADESALTGESAPVKKDADLVLNASTPLAERRNMVYAGTFAEQGTAVMAVTAVGGGTEMGNIAGELSGKVDMNSPLQQKLAKLGKVVTAVGAVAAVIVFVLSIVRLALGGNLSFETVGDVFITSIVLVVAAVPEGLPTIVAVSLALNMIKLARENALIRKLIATETAGCVSVICSDKTGTLTENRMTVDSVCAGEYCQLPEKVSREILKQNFALNATAEIVRGGKKTEYRGNATECALLTALEKADKGYYERARERYPVLGGVPFSSERKYMMTTIGLEKGTRTLLKGAPEAVLPMTNLTAEQRRSVLTRIGARQKQARRVIAFAHADGWSDGEKFIFDGFVTITDPVRKDVKDAVRLCRRAGIEVKMLTGDNYLTASAVARELNLIQSDAEVISASDLEGLSDDDLKKLLRRVKVVARSTPATKLAVVRALKECGEVVAVTGDGINDAPAIRHADVGIAMGVTGAEITKEASDVVLLDDSFSTIVKAVCFGRNVYRNLQRFIMFQLTVNVSAVLVIIASLLLGYPAPFNTLQLLWINIIMDGPPALTLGLEAMDRSLMNGKPVPRGESIVTLKMFLRILIHGGYIAAVFLLQLSFDFLRIPAGESAAAFFTIFVLFQLFNAFNSRELGKRSALYGFRRNKWMPIAFGLTFLLHVVIVQFGGALFGISPLSFLSWVKVIAAASSVVVISEIYKAVYRITHKNTAPKVNKTARIGIH